MVGVSVINLVGYTGDFAERAAVTRCEFARETFGRCGKYREVVVIPLRELIGAGTHVGDYSQPETLRFVAFAVMFACQGDKALGKADESDTECALIDDAFDCVVGAERVGSVPQS